MEAQKLTGRNAGVLKYDVLTALSVAALADTATMQTSILRLMALVTARYNWQTDEFCVGQRDIARMWSVNERTVKREIKRLTQSGILICKRQGVRGRVGAYTLNYTCIAELSKNSWCLVGPDFEARMCERYVKPISTNVIPLHDFHQPSEEPSIPAERGTWACAMALLAVEAPSLYQAWLSKLKFVRFEHGVLRLRAPSTFVQHYVQTHHLSLLIRHVEQELGVVDHVEFLV